jgi:hypothetical protein
MGVPKDDPRVRDPNILCANRRRLIRANGTLHIENIYRVDALKHDIKSA